MPMHLLHWQCGASMRRSRLRSVSRSASSKRRRAAQFGPQAEQCRRLPCCACGGQPSEPHHEPPRSVGGKDEDTVPLCWYCHRLCHSWKAGRAAWWEMVGVDPSEVKRQVRREVEVEV
jgi:hypothetical protein